MISPNSYDSQRHCLLIIINIKDMENCRVGFLRLSLGVFLFLHCAQAAENPLKNVNLAPFWQWRSAYECMQNFSDACTSEKDKLTLNGVLNVNKSEVREYCKAGGCGEHTKNVLTCISYAKRDFWFANRANVQNLTETINHGCKTYSSINTTAYKSSAIRAYQNLYVPLAASLATMLVVNIFNK